MNAAGSTLSSDALQLPTPPSRPFSIAELHASILREQEAANSQLSRTVAESVRAEPGAEQRAKIRERVSLNKTRAAAAELYEDGELARRLRCRWDSWSRTAEERELHIKKVERQRKKRKLSPNGVAAGLDGQNENGSDSGSSRVCLVEDCQNERTFDSLLPAAFHFDTYAQNEDNSSSLAQSFAHRVELSEQNLLRQPLPAQDLETGGLGPRVKALLKQESAARGKEAQRMQKRDPCLILTIDVYSRPVLVKTRRSRKGGRNGADGAIESDEPPRSAPVGDSETPNTQPEQSWLDESIVEEGDDDQGALSPSPEPPPRQLRDLDGTPVLTQTLEISSTSSLRLLREAIMCRWDDVPREMDQVLDDPVSGLDLPKYMEKRVESDHMLVIEDTIFCSDLSSASFR